MDKSKALKYLYRLITFKDYLEAELIKKLRNKDTDDVIIDELIEEFKKYGYIDDKKYIETFVYFSINRLTGPYKIKNKLFMKGANLEIVEEELSKQYTVEKQIKNIKKLIKKSNKEDNKLIDYCLRKGYSIDLVLQVVNSKEEQ